MTIRFNPSNTPTPTQRKLALVARIIATVATEPRTPYEIRRTIEADPDFSWANPGFIWDTVCQLAHNGRLERSYREERSVPVFGLPDNPFAGFAAPALSNEAKREIDLRIIDKLPWPKFFHIPTKDLLHPFSKTRTGYDVRVDMNRF